MVMIIKKWLIGDVKEKIEGEQKKLADRLFQLECDVKNNYASHRTLCHQFNEIIKRVEKLEDKLGCPWSKSE